MRVFFQWCLVAVLIACVFAVYKFDAGRDCEAMGAQMGVHTRYGVRTGCMVWWRETRWVPLEQVRFDF